MFKLLMHLAGLLYNISKAILLIFSPNAPGKCEQQTRDLSTVDGCLK